MIQIIQYFLIALGTLGSLYVAYRIARGQYATTKPMASFVAYAALVAILGAMNVYLFLLPMAMRM